MAQVFRIFLTISWWIQFSFLPATVAGEWSPPLWQCRSRSWSTICLLHVGRVFISLQW